MAKLMDISEPPLVTQILTKVKENGIYKYFFAHCTLLQQICCVTVKLFKLVKCQMDSLSTFAVIIAVFCSIPEFQRTYTQDGVCLTESGLCQLQSLCVQTARRRRPKPKLKLKIINQNSVAVLQTPPDPQSELFRDGDMDDSRGKECVFVLKGDVPLFSFFF